MINDDVESKMALQRTKHKELICQLKSQLEDLEKYAYETGDADLPQCMLLERQNIIISKSLKIHTFIYETSTNSNVLSRSSERKVKFQC